MSYKHQVILCTCLIVGIVVFDQLVKLWALSVLANAPGGVLPFIPGFIAFRYVQNTGAAFSILSGHTWLLGILSAVLAGLIIWLLYRSRNENSMLLRLSLCFIAGGAIGNVIDRLGRGYVIDMLDFEFMNFAIFNVADSFVCVGAVMFCIYIIASSRSKDEKSAGEAGGQEDGEQRQNGEIDGK